MPGELARARSTRSTCRRSFTQTGPSQRGHGGRGPRVSTWIRTGPSGSATRSEHGHFTETDEQLADARRVNFPQGSSALLAQRTVRITGPLCRARDPNPAVSPPSDPESRITVPHSLDGAGRRDSDGGLLFAFGEALEEQFGAAGLELDVAEPVESTKGSLGATCRSLSLSASPSRSPEMSIRARPLAGSVGVPSMTSWNRSRVSVSVRDTAIHWLFLLPPSGPQRWNTAAENTTG